MLLLGLQTSDPSCSEALIRFVRNSGLPYASTFQAAGRWVAPEQFVGRLGLFRNQPADRLLDGEWISVETRDAVVGHVEATGILDCERIVDLSQVDKSKVSLLNLGLFADYERIPAGIQFKYPLPPDMNEIQIRISDFSGTEQGTGLAVYLRIGAPILHEPGRVDGLGLEHAVPVTYDAVLEVDERDEVLYINTDVLPELRPGMVLHWSVASINRTRIPMDAVYLSASIGAEASRLPASGSVQEKSGCHTLPAHKSDGWPRGVLVLLVFAVARRRCLKL